MSTFVVTYGNVGAPLTPRPAFEATTFKAFVRTKSQADQFSEDDNESCARAKQSTDRFALPRVYIVLYTALLVLKKQRCVRSAVRFCERVCITIFCWFHQGGHVS